eukprot:gene5555-4191_t
MSASATMDRGSLLMSGAAEEAHQMKDEHASNRAQLGVDMQSRALREAHAGVLPASVARKYKMQGLAKRQSPIVKAHKSRPQSASAAFRTTNRDQHAKTGKYGVNGDPGVPHVGHYNPKHGYRDSHVTSVNIKGFNTKDYRGELKPPPGWIGEDGDAEHTSGDHATSGSPRRCRNQTAGHDAGPANTHSFTGLFKGAHQVHDKKAAQKQGTTSFKTVPRPSPNVTSTANHLFNAYQREGLHSATDTKTKGLAKFGAQTSRIPPGVVADTPPALGPGAYYRKISDLPHSRTGRHVMSAHAKLSHTTDFARSTAQPGSAKPPTRRPESAPAVSTQDAQAALNALYGEHGHDLDPSVLISIRHLQHLSDQAETRNHVRCASAKMGSSSMYPTPSSMYPAPKQDSILDEQIPPTGVEALLLNSTGQRPNGETYLGLGEIQKYSSTGLARTVPGGTISNATRAGVTMGLRVMSVEGVVAPASGPLIMGAGVDIGTYDPRDEVQGHRLRSHSTTLPPNRNALSKQWVNSTALAYM